MDKKLKVVWLCHLTNEQLNEKYGVAKDMCAYWMTQFLDIVRDRNLDIHIVAPNYYSNKDEHFSLDGVEYHFYKFYSGVGNIKIAYIENCLFNGLYIRKKVASIIKKISPDIVHLFGAENITYSQGVLDVINSYPTLVSFQGYIQKAPTSGSFFRRFSIKTRVKNEIKILKNCRYISFGEFEGESQAFYEETNNKSHVFKINFPFKKPSIDASLIPKVYDLVFWGRVTVDKGVEDLIHAVSIIRKVKDDVKCLILGGGSPDYLDKLESLVTNLELKENVIFGGFQKTNEELFSNAAKALVYVLPTHYDALPGSIRESMLMHLPVVSYPVGDIPLLNKNQECIALSKYRDIDDLANTIRKLLTDEEYRNLLIDNAYATISQSSSNKYIGDQIVSTYTTIISGK